MDGTTLLPLLGAVAIVTLFAGYGCYEWGRFVLEKAKTGWGADRCRNRFAVPTVLASMLPCVTVVVFQRLGLVNLDDGNLKIMFAMIAAMGFGFFFLAIAFAVFSIKLRKTSKS